MLAIRMLKGIGYIGYTALTLSLTGGWRILPTNFKTLLSQNTFKLKKSEKNCNPSLLSYGHLLLKRVPHTMPFYAFFCLVLPKNLSLWPFFEAVSLLQF